VISESSSTPATCKNLTIKNIAALKVLQDKALVVYGDFTICP
jgi:hypothetical protein